MTEREQRAADLDSLARYAEFLAMPGDESSPTLTAMARQLPHLLACARFVEEHGSTVSLALITCNGHFLWCSPEHSQTMRASAALASLRHSAPPPQAEGSG